MDILNDTLRELGKNVGVSKSNDQNFLKYSCFKMVTQFLVVGLLEMDTTLLLTLGQLKKQLKPLFFNKFKSRASTLKLEDLKIQQDQYPPPRSLDVEIQISSHRTPIRKRQLRQALCSKPCVREISSKGSTKPKLLKTARSRY